MKESSITVPTNVVVAASVVFVAIQNISQADAPFVSDITEPIVVSSAAGNDLKI